MAEQFLSRLQDIEKSIKDLDETLKRMVTILTTVTEIKSEVRIAKDEIIEAVSNVSAAPSEGPTPPTTEEISMMVKNEVAELGSMLSETLDEMKDELAEIITSSIPEDTGPPYATTAAAATPTPEPEIVVTPSETPAPIQVPADKAMKIADQLQNILKSLKMGCVAGDVLEVMTESKASIMKIVPSDPIMVKIDRWAGVVSGYPKRNELQARDILKIKKEIREEIPKYRPA